MQTDSVASTLSHSYMVPSEHQADSRMFAIEQVRQIIKESRSTETNVPVTYLYALLSWIETLEGELIRINDP